MRYAGKRLTAKKIGKIIDKIPHRKYVEPFAGLATVLRNKKPSEKEIVNDLDCQIMSFAKRKYARVKGVKTTCGKDYKEVIRHHDAPTTLFYLDPPYDGVKPSNWIQRHYKFNSVPIDDFVKTIRKIKGKVVISHSPKQRKKLCQKTFKCKYIHFKFFGQPRKDLLVIKK